MGENTKSSSISFRRDSPIVRGVFSGYMELSQQSREKRISVTLPNLSINMSRIYPFTAEAAGR